jgi:D-serine deaminase-like pyridoxal phosphate-dependent protein
MMEDRAYFDALSGALRTAGVFRPALIIDRDRLDANIRTIRAGLAPGLPLRIVDKSLPSIPLLAHIMAMTGATRIMSFHLPVTLAVLQAFPDVEVLYGKPLPIGALAAHFAGSGHDDIQDLIQRTVFLIDSLERLSQYAAFAQKSGLTLRIAFEVDVGMHRGGFSSPKALSHAVACVHHEDTLQLEGLMGYEAHIAQIPALFGGPKAESLKVKERLRRFLAVLPEDARRIVNTGGSKTVFDYAIPGAANDISVGSAFLKPSDFDSAVSASLKPAVFIATPVLKVLQTRLPGPALVTRMLQTLGLFPRRGCFLYGGKWMAEPVHPARMKPNGVWGLSSNQQLMALPDGIDLYPDDFVFFRPTQSEAVLQHFGSLQVYGDGKISDSWPVLPP